MDSSFPANDHKAILNKLNIKSQTKRKRIWKLQLTTTKAPPWNSQYPIFWGLKPFLRARNPARGSAVVPFIHIRIIRSAWRTSQLINESKQQTYKSRFKMKQDEYSTARPTLKRWSKTNPEAEPWWLQTSLLKVFGLSHH